MSTNEPDEYTAEEQALIEALRQLAAATEGSADFHARVMATARQSLAAPVREPDGPPQALRSSQALRRRRRLPWPPSRGARVLAAALLLSLAGNVWLAGRAQEALQAQHEVAALQAQVRALQVASREGQRQSAEAGLSPKVTVFRGHQYTAVELAYALFPERDPPVVTRRLDPQQPATPAIATVVLPLVFAPHTVTIPSDSNAVLDSLGEVLTSSQYAAYRIEVAGHADSREAAEADAGLSRERAENVKRYLVQSFGIAPERVRVQGYGASQPRATNATPEGRRVNRRVEVLNFGQAPSGG